jgi:hypothetical protein
MNHFDSFLARYNAFFFLGAYPHLAGSWFQAGTPCVVGQVATRSLRLRLARSRPPAPPRIGTALVPRAPSSRGAQDSFNSKSVGRQGLLFLNTQKRLSMWGCMEVEGRLNGVKL